MKFTNEQIARSIKTGRLALDDSDLTRYFVAGVTKISLTGLVIFASVSFAACLADPSESSVYAWLAAMIFFPTLMFLTIATIVKFRALNLVTIETMYSAAETRKVLTEFFKHFKFKIENNRKNLIIATTRPTKRIGHTRNERITILIDNKKVHLTSICAPDGSFYIRSLYNRSDNIGLLRSILSGMRVLADK
jgi:hypothetical protein